MFRVLLCLCISVIWSADTIYDMAGTLTSEGYPNDWNKGNQWKFRVSGATKYDLYFEDIDLDPECYSYITVYDDAGIGLPVAMLCDEDTGHIMTVYSSKITVSLVKAYSGVPPGKRGLKFHFNVNDHEATTTTEPATEPTEPSTDENGSTITQPTTSSTTKVSTTTQPTGTNPAGYPTAPPGPSQDTSAFPLPDPSIDAHCGLSFVDASINNFDYVEQDKYVRGETTDWNNGDYDSRVISGEEAVPHSFPWQTTVGDNLKAYCGATIVTDEFVVTAAHCGVLVFIGSYSSDHILVGMHDQRIDSEAEKQKIEIAKVFNHPLYHKKTKSHDVSVLKLKNRIRFGEHVQPACMAHIGWRIPEGFICVVSGWGQTTSSAGSTSKVLNQAALNHMKDSDCFVLYQNANLDTTDDMQCFGTRQSEVNHQGACNGDSGGPLQCYIHGKWYWSGIVSFGASGCDINIASVYGKVYHEEIQTFITSTIDSNK